MTHIFVQNLITLDNTLVAELNQHSELVVAQASTHKDETSFKKDDLLKMSMLLLESLQRNVLSQDVWVLSYLAFRDRATESGLDAETIHQFIMGLESARGKRFASNPMSSMF